LKWKPTRGGSRWMRTEGQTDVWQAALALMRFTHGYLKYLPNSTHVHTHMRDVIVQRSGVCQDYAHFLIGLCRSVKFPRVYVSGYLATEIASATHAWAEVFIPGLGWRRARPDAQLPDRRDLCEDRPRTRLRRRGRP